MRRDEADRRWPRSFDRLLVAWFASMTGDGLRMIALPLLAVKASPNPAAVALVAAFTALPWLVIAVPAGALVDRWDPARAATWAHLARAAVSVVLVVAVIGDMADIPVLCAFGFLLTSAQTFADGAEQSLVVALVPPRQLERANGRFVVVETIALDLVGPLTGGVAFTLVTWLPFAISAVGFLVAAILVAGLPHARAGHGAAVRPPGDDAARPSADQEALAGAPAQPEAELWTGPLGPVVEPGEVPMPEPAPEPMTAQIRQGLKGLFGDPVLRLLVLTVAVMAAANASQDGVLVIYATSTLGMRESLYPTILAAYSVGTLVSAAVVGRLVPRYPGGRVMLAALLGAGGALLLMGLAPHDWVAWFSYAVLGLCLGSWNVLSASRRQRRTPREMVARVSSAFRVVAWGVVPIGALIGGRIGEKWGVPAVFTVAGAVILLLGAVVARSFLAGEPDGPASPATSAADMAR